ncbi:hypothetical protein Aduo_007709 [Ancylostoma duodenale]
MSLQIDLIHKLRSAPASFWSGLVKKYFTRPHVTVIGVPSKKMVAQFAENEKARIEQQRRKLGEEGMKKCEEDLRQAKEENAREPNVELFQEFIVREQEVFNRFRVDADSNLGDSALSQRAAKFLKQSPFPTTLHNCPTKFIEMFLLLDSSGLTTEQRAWLLLYIDLLFESPAKIDRELKSADEVTMLYTKDLVNHSAHAGISDFFDKFVALRIVVDAETGFLHLAKWAEIFTTGIVFDVHRVKQRAQKLANDAREFERDACCVAETALDVMTNQTNTNSYMISALVLEEFHEKVAKWCVSHPTEVIKKLEEVRSALFCRGVNAHFVCSVDLIDNKSFEPQQWSFVEKSFGKAEKFMARSGESVDTKFAGRQKVLGVGGSESSFICIACMMDCDWMSDALVPTMLLAKYLGLPDGPLWCAIRGSGLAYGAKMYVYLNELTITLHLNNCAHPVQACEKAKKCVKQVVEGGVVVESEFEAAKRKLIGQIMEREETVSGAGILSIIGRIRGSPPDYQKQLCERIWNASTEDMILLGGPRVANLFENYALAITVHPSKVPEIKAAFPDIEEATVSSLNFISALFV